MAYVKKGIRCNTVVVGTMHTPLVEQRLVKQLGAGDAAALIAQRNAAVPMGYMGTGGTLRMPSRFWCRMKLATSPASSSWSMAASVLPECSASFLLLSIPGTFYA